MSNDELPDDTEELKNTIRKLKDKNEFYRRELDARKELIDELVANEYDNNPLDDDSDKLSVEDQKRILELLDEASETAGLPKNKRKRKRVAIEFGLFEMDKEDLIDELETEISLLEWTNPDSEERYELNEDVIRELMDDGLDRSQLELLGFDTSKID